MDNIKIFCRPKSKKYPNGHWPAESCVKEERYLIDSEAKNFGNWMDVICFDCLAQEYCTKQNCTEKPLARCSYCQSEMNICNECAYSENEEVDYIPICCEDCRACNICLQLGERRSQKLDEKTGEIIHAFEYQCPSCEKLTCNLPVHSLFHCHVGDTEHVSERMKNCMQFLMDEIIALRQQMKEMDREIMNGYCQGHDCQYRSCRY